MCLWIMPTFPESITLNIPGIFNFFYSVYNRGYMTYTNKIPIARPSFNSIHHFLSQLIILIPEKNKQV